MNTFAEIELPLPSEQKESPYAREKIVQTNQRSPLKVFKEMRTFGKASHNISFFNDAAETFVQQAKYMANFTDYCDVVVPLDAYYTTYAEMNNAQFRTYFTWRTKVRQGQVEDISLSYAFCYIYELLNNIGVANANDGLDKLVAFWTAFRVHNSQIDSYMTEWTRDYFVVNCPTNNFASISNRFPVPYTNKQELFGNLKLGIWDINLVETNSRHKITKMSFYKNGNQKVIQDCLNAVFTELNNLFKANEIDLIDLYVAKSPNSYYAPFRGAAYAHGRYRDTTVKLSDYEVYSFKNGKWSVCEYYYTYLQATKGYILKTIEIEMRKALGGKQSLSPPKMDDVSVELRDGHRSWKGVQEWRKKTHELLKSKEFKRIIQSAVQAYCKTAEIVVKDGAVIEIKPIEIDLSKLDKIREEHEVTAKKLIIEQDLENNASEYPTEQIAAQQTAEASGFVGLVGSLNNEEIALIATLLKSELAPTNCELLIEAINEKSLTAIDDNIIGYVDGSPCLYEEYEDELRSLLGGNL